MKWRMAQSLPGTRLIMPSGGRRSELQLHHQCKILRSSFFDTDYIPLASKLNQQGKRAIAILPIQSASKKSLFSQSGWQVLVNSVVAQPGVGMKAYSLPDGSGGIYYLASPDELPHLEQDIYLIVAYLKYLGYLARVSPTARSAEVVPAIAKFWHMNRIGRLDVYPHWYALHSMLNLIRTTRADVKCADEHGLAFVLPVQNAARSKSLGWNPARVAAGGGPFYHE